MSSSHGADKFKTSYRVALIGSSGGGSATISSGVDIVESIQRNVISIVSRGVRGVSKSTKSETNQTSIYFVSITDVALVQSQQGLDFSCTTSEDDSVTLWVMEAGGSLSRKRKGKLCDVNCYLEIEDKRIADLILSDEIDAIITISSDPEGANKLTVAAAIQMSIPILGTGGTSLSYISTSGGNVIGCSGGSVATTAVTRGICIAASLAAYSAWGDMNYLLPKEPKLAKFRSVVGAALPILLSVSLVKASLPLCANAASTVMAALGRLLLHPSVDEIMHKYPVIPHRITDLSRSLLSDFSKHTSENIGEILESSYQRWQSNLLHSLEHKVIPVVISALTCLEVCQLQELSLISGAAAGALLSGNILSAFISGTLCGFLLPWLLIKCAKKSLLPTSTATLSVGASAMISGIIASIFCHPLSFLTVILSQKLSDVTGTLALYLCGSVFVGYTVLGGILGWAVSWGSENGYYHLVMLPLIAVYMDGGRFSVLGLLDVLCLCVPCAGVCAAVYVVVAFMPLKVPHRTPGRLVVNKGNNPTSTSTNPVDDGSPVTANKDSVEDYDHHLRLGRKGTLSNLLMGDYVEACYPYTVSNRWVLLSVRISSAIAGALVLGYFGAQTDCMRGSAPSGSYSQFSESTSDSRNGATYAFQSSAYLPLPVAMFLAVLGTNQPCAYDKTHCTVNTSYCNNNSYHHHSSLLTNLPHMNEEGLLVGTYHTVIAFYNQYFDYSYPYVRVTLVAALLTTFFLPFFTAIIVYSDKRELKPLL